MFQVIHQQADAETGGTFGGIRQVFAGSGSSGNV